MTIRKAEKISGCEIRVTAPGVWSAFEDGNLRASVKATKEKVAAWLITEEIYRQNRAEAMRRAKFKCENCGGYGPLHAHHKVYRGMAGANRDDSVKNILVLCLSCHEGVHSGKVTLPN